MFQTAAIGSKSAAPKPAILPAESALPCSTEHAFPRLPHPLAQAVRARLAAKFRGKRESDLESIGDSELRDAIPRLLANGPTLTALNLAYSRLDDSDVQALASALAQNSGLTALSLRYCDVGASDALADTIANAVDQNRRASQQAQTSP